MGSPLSIFPPTPLNLATAPVIAASSPIVTTVTLTAPTTATLITGMSTSVTVPSVASYIRVTVFVPSVTVSAAATLTLSVYSGATSGALTTLVQAVTFVSATGQTTAGGNYEFLIPATGNGTTFPQTGSTTFLSITATASTGNFVVNGAATTPASFIVESL